MSKVTPIVRAYQPQPLDSEAPRPLRRTPTKSQPYPVGALGEIIAAAAHAVHDRVQAPMALCAQSVLATATLAVQHLADVEMPGGRRKPLSEFFVTVAESGERKTSADDEAAWCARRREEVLREGYGEAVMEWQNRKLAWERQRSSVAGDSGYATVDEKTAALNALGEEPAAPLQPVVLVEDPTPEGLIKALRIGQPSIGIFSSEGGRFIGGHGMNEDNRLRTATTLSSIWDGSPIKRIRQGDDFVFLFGRRVSMHLMIQPVLAPKLLGDDMLVGQGLLSRTLVVAPESTAGTRFWREPTEASAHALSRFSARCLDAFETPCPVKAGTTSEIEPRPLPMSPEAAGLWVAYSNHVEANLAPDQPLAPIRGWGAKQAEHAARLAGVLALMESIDVPRVEHHHMRGGADLADYYAKEALRLYESTIDDPLLILAEKVLRWLHADWPRLQGEKGFDPLGYVSLPDVYQWGPNGVGNASRARKVMELLESHGWVTKQGEPVVVLGERRRDVWHVTECKAG